MQDPLARLPEPEYVRNQRELELEDGECRTLKGLGWKERQEWYALRQSYLDRQEWDVDFFGTKEVD